MNFWGELFAFHLIVFSVMCMFIIYFGGLFYCADRWGEQGLWWFMISTSSSILFILTRGR